MSIKDFTIGSLSAHTAVKIETIRYYEKIGLLPPPPRKEGGHRIYDDKLAGRLRFIRRGRELGFALADIRLMLEIEDDQPSCERIYELAQRHLQDVRDKIRDLKRLEKNCQKYQRGVSAGTLQIVQSLKHCQVSLRQQELNAPI